MPMKNFHKLSMALANGEADSNLFGAYGNGKRLHLIRTKNLGERPNDFLKTHASRIHKPIAYQKMNQRDQNDRLRTLKMNVLAQSELHDDNEEHEDQMEIKGGVPMIENMVISNNNLNFRQPQGNWSFFTEPFVKLFSTWLTWVHCL